MDLTDVKNVCIEEGCDGSYVCPVNMHVYVRVNDLDEECVTMLVVTKEGHVKEDGAILLNVNDEVIAKDEDELRAWLQTKLEGQNDA